MNEAEQKLLTFRAQIDAIDQQISQLLLDRCRVVRNVAALKTTHWPADCYIRSGREGRMHRSIAARFKGTDIPPVVAVHIWRQLIAAATHLESPLRIATLSSASHHPWLAREYFGVQASLTTHANLTELLESLAQKRCTIALLPAPIGAHWHDAAALHDAGFTLFASLPATAQPLPGGASPALAFARITPEASGDDVSYFLRDGMVETANGFITTREGTVFLGAHPRPVMLEALS